MYELQVIGNLGKDAVVYESNGNKAISFTVAVNKKWKDREGVAHEKTDWISCSYWKREGQSLSIVNYLKKGTKVFLRGEPNVRTWQDNEGRTMAGINLTISKVELLSASESGSEQKPNASQANNEKPVEYPDSEFQGEESDDLPF